MLKRTLAGLVVAGLLLGTGAVRAEESAFPEGVDEAGVYLPSESTYADRFRSELEQLRSTTAATDSAIPEGIDEAGIYLPSESTYADLQRGEIIDSMRVQTSTSAIPEQNATD